MMAGAPGMSNRTSFTWVFQLPAWRLIAPEAAPASTLAAFSAAPASSVLPASSDLPQPASAKAAPSAATVAKLFMNFHPPVVGRAETPARRDRCTPIAAARRRYHIGGHGYPDSHFARRERHAGRLRSEEHKQEL